MYFTCVPQCEPCSSPAYFAIMHATSWKSAVGGGRGESRRPSEVTRTVCGATTAATGIAMPGCGAPWMPTLPGRPIGGSCTRCVWVDVCVWDCGGKSGIPRPGGLGGNGGRPCAEGPDIVGECGLVCGTKFIGSGMPTGGRCCMCAMGGRVESSFCDETGEPIMCGGGEAW